MTPNTLLLIVLVIGAVGIFLALLRFRSRGDENPLLLLQQQLDGLRQELRLSLEGVGRQVNDRLQDQSKVLAESGKSLNERLDNAAKAFVSLNNELGQLKEGSKRILEVGKDIASLQESLRAPKFRGGFGEFFLADLLGQILPSENFQLQYAFKNGERVDAVVFSQEGIIPIDSKFPLENFRRLVASQTEEEKKTARKDFVGDVKRHIDSISDKYICPDEGTLNFALMYIPAENVYYETIIKDENGGVLSYAQSKRVFPVSPNSFYAYLQTIAIGLRGMKITSWARELDARIERLKGDLTRFSEEFSQIGTHLKNARGKFETAEKRLDQLGERLDQIVLPAEEGTKALPLKSVKS
ncbi:MAG: DNA recombination protein RmuC [Deltaproteobacteria bacterium]|nr:DNA recombination protein RmuC [Deltaproteobacteria bacterium]